MNPIKPDPAWSPEDHLERVYRRGRQLRRRRQLGASSAVVAAVVGLAVMIGGPTSTVLHPLRTITGAVTGGGSNEVSATDETSTTAVDSPDEGTRRDPNRATDGPTTTARRSSSVTTTTAASSTATSVVSGGGSTPPPTSPLAACKAGDLTWTTATNKSSYRPNETVTISVHARNSSDRPCYAPRPCGAAVSATVTDSAGSAVWQSPSTTAPCDFGTPAPLLNPRDSYSYGTAGSWDQAGSTGARAPVGTYRVTARRGSTTASGATFALR